MNRKRFWVVVAFFVFVVGMSIISLLESTPAIGEDTAGLLTLALVTGIVGCFVWLNRRENRSRRSREIRSQRLLAQIREAEMHRNKLKVFIKNYQKDPADKAEAEVLLEHTEKRIEELQKAERSIWLEELREEHKRLDT